MIAKIAHISDLHMRKTPTRNNEYEKVFKRLVESLRKNKPDRIVIVGDLVHDYLDLQGEQLIMANNLLNDLSKIAPVRVTRGNHDFRKKNIKRIDSVKAIIKTLNNDNVIYYDKTGFYDDENIIWAVWHHGDAKNDPWISKEGKEHIKNKPIDKTFIDLFHDPINGCKSTTGFEMKSKSYYKLNDFKGDYSFLGDIHLQQFLNKDRTKAYSSSLLSQDFSEGDDNFHGYLLWDIINKSVQEIPIENEYSFKNIKISQYVDFDDLDIEINNPTKFMRIRFIWNTLPQTRNKDNERKITEHIKLKYGNTITSIANKNEFLESEKLEVNENVTLENITEKSVQHEIFKEYLTKIGVEDQLINDVISLDEEILNEINISNSKQIEWNIIRFGGKNFMSYGEFNIDWRDMDGLFQITGLNTAGKTTILKAITYTLFNKTLETETRLKFGDKRFVNNRNDAKSCETYIVIEANNEYFGIKRKTEITKSKDGEINGAPTVLEYYLLTTPDDELNSETVLDNLNEDRRVLTQSNIENIIGTYDNFMRIVMTTSDTLNRILSSDMAIFIDSLLYDSGLDIFDKKLDGIKSYQKRANEKSRISCNVEVTTNDITKLTEEIKSIQSNIIDIETNKLPDAHNRINVGKKYVEDLTKKLYKIDSETYNLDVNDVQEHIDINKQNVVEFKVREKVLIQSITQLKETYDENRLEELNVKKNEFKLNEYNLKLKIKTIEQTIRDEEHTIEIINGEIFRLKQDGVKLKNEIIELKNSKICSQCGQVINKKEHQDHIKKMIEIKESEMFDIADKITIKESIDKITHQKNIDKLKSDIKSVENEIEQYSLNMDVILKEIGQLTNDMNDVNKRKELQLELDNIPIKIQNEELKITINEQKIISYENSLIQIEENKKIEKGIDASKQKLISLEEIENDLKEDIYIKKTSVAEKQLRVKNSEQLIIEFKQQEYQDTIINLYKKCVHRDGIPKQMLSNYIIPKINVTLEKILSVAQFKVWLDADDLKPKLVYNDRPQAIIDCISASGKERTFSSIVLKFALNQINVKAKPAIFLLDEVMGKLDENSIEEFIEVLQLIKNNINKVLIIEHNANINPDYLIEVQSDADGISSLVLE